MEKLRLRELLCLAPRPSIKSVVDPRFELRPGLKSHTPNHFTLEDTEAPKGNLRSNDSAEEKILVLYSQLFCNVVITSKIFFLNI